MGDILFNHRNFGALRHAPAKTDCGYLGFDKPMLCTPGPGAGERIVMLTLQVAVLFAQVVIRAGAPPPDPKASPPSPRVAALIAPVAAAYDKVEAEQAKLPPPTSDRERLERLFAHDQAGRLAQQKLDFTDLTEAERTQANRAIWAEIIAHDLQDQAALKAMRGRTGGFPISVYGRQGAMSAFLIVQHAVNDPPLMRETLADLDRLKTTGEAEGGWYALMYDRVALEFDRKPQRYGSQVWCQAGKWQVRELEDSAHLDERRKAVGLRQTEAEYLASFGDAPCH